MLHLAVGLALHELFLAVKVELSNDLVSAFVMAFISLPRVRDLVSEMVPAVLPDFTVELGSDAVCELSFDVASHTVINDDLEDEMFFSLFERVGELCLELLRPSSAGTTAETPAIEALVTPDAEEALDIDLKLERAVASVSDGEGTPVLDRHGHEVVVLASEAMEILTDLLLEGTLALDPVVERIVDSALDIERMPVLDPDAEEIPVLHVALDVEV